VTADRSFSPSRLARLRNGLTRAEWWRVGGMVAVVVALNVLGWGMLSLLLAGLILAVATLRTRSLFLAIGLHAGWIIGQQGLQWAAKFRIKPPEALLPWIGPNVVSGAVPTGLVPSAMLLLTMALAFYYLSRARTLRHSS